MGWSTFSSGYGSSHFLHIQNFVWYWMMFSWFFMNFHEFSYWYSWLIGWYWTICLFWRCLILLFEKLKSGQPGGCWSTRPQPGANVKDSTCFSGWKGGIPILFCPELANRFSVWNPRKNSKRSSTVKNPKCWTAWLTDYPREFWDDAWNLSSLPATGKAGDLTGAGWDQLHSLTSASGLGRFWSWKIQRCFFVS